MFNTRSYSHSVLPKPHRVCLASEAGVHAPRHEGAFAAERNFWCRCSTMRLNHD